MVLAMAMTMAGIGDAAAGAAHALALAQDAFGVGEDLVDEDVDELVLLGGGRIRHVMRDQDRPQARNG